MKKYFLMIALASFLFACGGSEGKNGTDKSDSTQVAKDEQVEIIEIKNFDSLAGNFVGKKVQVKGLVDHVCKHGGKKLFVVDGDANVHIVSDKRFADSLVGNEVSVVGIVKEFKMDENQCAHMDEENKKHLDEGERDKEQFEKVKKHIDGYRDSMKAAGVDHLSFYSLEFVEFK